MGPLVCKICNGIVRNPVQCQQCECLFCAEEIRWLPGHSCPTCNTKLWANDIYQSYKDALSGLRFNCPATGCSKSTESLSYDEYIQHQK
jgi:hypothetical protein